MYPQELVCESEDTDSWRRRNDWPKADTSIGKQPNSTR